MIPCITYRSRVRGEYHVRGLNMGCRRRLVSWAVLFFVPVLMSHGGTEHEERYRDFDEATFMGMVYDYHNRPCSDALIIIDDVEGPRTDMNGRFFLQSVSRGTHEITIRKRDYEDLTVAFDFFSTSQVLHAKLISFDQLLDMAEEAVSQGRLHDAELTLERADTIRPRDPVSLYVRAVVCKERGAVTEAVAVLQSILDGGYRDPYVYLALGNLCEYHLSDGERAVFYLEKYLQYERNDEVEQRLADLKAESTEE
jgi:tetratricopeptide (TPR) repeat protein